MAAMAQKELTSPFFLNKILSEETVWVIFFFTSAKKVIFSREFVIVEDKFKSF